MVDQVKAKHVEFILQKIDAEQETSDSNNNNNDDVTNASNTESNSNSDNKTKIKQSKQKQEIDAKKNNNINGAVDGNTKSDRSSSKLFKSAQAILYAMKSERDILNTMANQPITYTKYVGVQGTCILLLMYTCVISNVQIVHGPWYTYI
jgi:hypothetical protein